MYLEDGLRAAVVYAAEQEIGPGDIPKYWASCGIEEPYPIHWCGAFCVWALHEAGLALDVKWIIGKGFASVLPIVTIPSPGDIVYIDQPWQHHAICESCIGDIVYTIDGNQPDVRKRTRQRRKVMCYSIQPYIDEYVNRAAEYGLKK
jgi:hypothetical protein